MSVKHSTLRTQYQPTTHQLHIHHPFTGTFTGTKRIAKLPDSLPYSHHADPVRAVDCAHFAPPTQRTRRDGLVHCRSVPLPVALGGDDYTHASKRVGKMESLSVTQSRKSV